MPFLKGGDEVHSTARGYKDNSNIMLCVQLYVQVWDCVGAGKAVVNLQLTRIFTSRRFTAIGLQRIYNHEDVSHRYYLQQLHLERIALLTHLGY